MAQWVQLYETQDDIVALILRTFGSVFPCMEIWDTGTGDIVMLGSKTPWQSGPEVFKAGFAHERVRLDMQMINLLNPEALMARRLASQRTAFAIVGPGPIQQDLHPVLEYIAPRAFYLNTGSQGLNAFDERTHRLLLSPPEQRALLARLTPAQSQFIFEDKSTVNGELWRTLFGQSAGETPCALPTPRPAPAPPTDGTILNLCHAAIAQNNWQQADQLVTYALQQEPQNPEAGYLKRIINRQLKGL
jgi:hypothetical protein